MRYFMRRKLNMGGCVWVCVWVCEINFDRIPAFYFDVNVTLKLSINLVIFRNCLLENIFSLILCNLKFYFLYFIDLESKQSSAAKPSQVFLHYVFPLFANNTYMISLYFYKLLKYFFNFENWECKLYMMTLLHNTMSTIKATPILL